MLFRSARAAGGSADKRAAAVAVLATAWAARLALHIATRNIGHGEDYRYRSMREKYGANFPLVSLGIVFLLQAVLMWIVSLPLQAVSRPGPSVPFGWLDIVGFAIWSAGYAFEAVADAQLVVFKKNPANKGRVLDTGLWRYSRHPNYFGECVIWWGFGLTALATGAWWALAGPAVMTILLLKVSGVSLLESTITERRPGYREYIERTSAFVPLPHKHNVKR